MLKFETLEDFSIHSEVNDYLVKVRLRRQADYVPTRFTTGPYCLDLTAGYIQRHYYGVDEKRAREIAARFLLEHVNGIAPTRH